MNTQFILVLILLVYVLAYIFITRKMAIRFIMPALEPLDSNFVLTALLVPFGVLFPGLIKYLQEYSTSSLILDQSVNDSIAGFATLIVVHFGATELSLVFIFLLNLVLFRHRNKEESSLSYFLLLAVLMIVVTLVFMPVMTQLMGDVLPQAKIKTFR